MEKQKSTDIPEEHLRLCTDVYKYVRDYLGNEVDKNTLFKEFNLNETNKNFVFTFLKERGVNFIKSPTKVGIPTILGTTSTGIKRTPFSEVVAEHLRKEAQSTIDIEQSIANKYNTYKSPFFRISKAENESARKTDILKRIEEERQRILNNLPESTWGKKPQGKTYFSTDDMEEEGIEF